MLKCLCHKMLRITFQSLFIFFVAKTSKSAKSVDFTFPFLVLFKVYVQLNLTDNQRKTEHEKRYSWRFFFLIWNHFFLVILFTCNEEFFFGFWWEKWNLCKIFDSYFGGCSTFGNFEMTFPPSQCLTSLRTLGFEGYRQLRDDIATKSINS